MKAVYDSSKDIFEDLGMEAIYEFEVEDMPVTVAVDTKVPLSCSRTGPRND